MVQYLLFWNVHCTKYHDMTHKWTDVATRLRVVNVKGKHKVNQPEKNLKNQRFYERFIMKP